MPVEVIEETTLEPDGPSMFRLGSAVPGSEHPEQQPGEVFLGYGNSALVARSPSYAQCGSLRWGTTIIDDKDEDRTEDMSKAPGEPLLPMFVSQEDYRRHVRRERMS